MRGRSRTMYRAGIHAGGASVGGRAGLGLLALLRRGTLSALEFQLVLQLLELFCGSNGMLAGCQASIRAYLVVG